MSQNHRRSAAREAAMKALYCWQYTQQASLELTSLALFTEKDENNVAEIDQAYYDDCLQGVIKHIDKIDEILQIYSARLVTNLDGVECAVLRLATYELQYRLDIPYRVIINEALELTKRFGAIEGFKFVNGVLDKIAEHRPDKAINKST